MEKEDCSICFYQYDKIQKVPRVLRCGHTFCQVCLEEIKEGSKKMNVAAAGTTITCPNCRVRTENVVCTKNLPENDGVFQGGSNGEGGKPGTGAPVMGGNLLNSPYEAAKRLARESASLMATGQRFGEFLEKMD